MTDRVSLFLFFLFFSYKLSQKQRVFSLLVRRLEKFENIRKSGGEEGGREERITETVKDTGPEEETDKTWALSDCCRC